MSDGSAGRKPAEVTDGLSHTIMVVEVDDKRAVEWTKPQDWQFDATQPSAGWGRAHPAGFCPAFADGSVRFLLPQIDATLFHALLTIPKRTPLLADDSNRESRGMWLSVLPSWRFSFQFAIKQFRCHVTRFAKMLEFTAVHRVSQQGSRASLDDKIGVHRCWHRRGSRIRLRPSNCPQVARLE